jgi:hypothetical protein
MKMIRDLLERAIAAKQRAESPIAQRAFDLGASGVSPLAAWTLPEFAGFREDAACWAHFHALIKRPWRSTVWAWLRGES